MSHNGFRRLKGLFTASPAKNSTAIATSSERRNRTLNTLPAGVDWRHSSAAGSISVRLLVDAARPEWWVGYVVM